MMKRTCNYCFKPQKTDKLHKKLDKKMQNETEMHQFPPFPQASAPRDSVLLRFFSFFEYSELNLRLKDYFFLYEQSADQNNETCTKFRLTTRGFFS